MGEDFGALLDYFRLRGGYSRNRLANRVGVDPSYVTRICHGDREPPRLHIIEAMIRELRLSVADRNRLLVAAGYVPEVVTHIGWDSALQAVADVLSDIRLTPEERAEFSSVVQSISARWRGGAQLAAGRTPVLAS